MFVDWTLHSMSGGRVSFCFGEQHVGWLPHFWEGKSAGVMQLHRELKRLYLPDAALINI